MREMSDDDIVIDVEGVGEFRYAQRTMLDTIKIRRRFLALAGPDSGDGSLDYLSDMVAVHEALLVSCPKGFEDLANLKANNIVGDMNADTFVFRLYSAFCAKEGEFRQKPGEDGKGKGA